MKMSAGKFLLPGVMVCVLAGSAVAQQLYVYPARGQSQAKQEQDTYECSSWAVQQTGFNPTVPPPVPQPSAPPPPGLFGGARSEEHTSELQSQFHLVCRLLLE